MLKIMFFLFINIINGQNIYDFDLRYGNNNKTMIINYYNLDFIYKNNLNSKLIIINKDSLLFKEEFENNFINVYLINKKSIQNNLINLDKFIKKNGRDTIKNNYIEKNGKNILYYNLNDNYFLKFDIKLKTRTKIFTIIDENLFLNFNKSLRNSNSINFVLKLMDSFYPKDFSYQINLISKLITDPAKNSITESIINDLKTNNGESNIIKVRRKKLTIDNKELLEKAEDFVSTISINYDIIMFNEYHQLPHTRFNFMYFLKKLKNNGFNYLALETLDSPKNEDDIFPNKISGYYLDEPTCSLMLSYALSLGFKLVSYEENEQCKNYTGNKGNCRDSIQAINLKNIYKFDEKAKIVVFGGHAHIEKKERSDAWKFTRVFLEELLPNKKIISIGQTKYIRTNLDEEDINTNVPLIYKLEDNQFDYNIISPFYNKYYNWYQTENHLMNNKIEIKKNNFKTLEIYAVYNNNEVINYPIFRINRENLLYNNVFLPKEINFKIVYKDDNNKILNQ